MNNQNLSPRATPSSYCLLKNFVKGLPPSYSSLSTHGVPALLGSLAGLLLAGLAEEKSGSMQVLPSLILPYWTFPTLETKKEKMLCSTAFFSIHSTPAAPLQWHGPVSTQDSTQLRCSGLFAPHLEIVEGLPLSTVRARSACHASLTSWPAWGAQDCWGAGCLAGKFQS